MSSIERMPTPFSYAQAVAAGDFVFPALHRGNGADFAAQFDSAFARLQATLAHFGLTLADLVKVNVEHGR